MKPTDVLPARQPATIKDIANALGLSHSTVSRALNDFPHISAETKARVREKAAELEYVVNSGARTLRHASSSLIGLVVPHSTNELSATMTRVLASRCQRAGYQLVLSMCDDDEEIELRQVKALRQARALGIIIIPAPNLLEETAQLLSSASVVQFSRSHPRLSAPAVSIDGAKGVAAAIHHLGQLGHHRIAYVGLTSDLSTGASRFAGFRRGMESCGAPIDPALVRQGPGLGEFGRTAAAGLLQSPAPPTAIVFGTTELTSGGYEAIRRAGVRLPEDLSVIGFGDPPWFRHVSPTLSTIAMSFEEAAETAISLLLRRIAEAAEGRPPEPAVSLVLDPYLIVRETTGRPRARPGF
ncbi:LacI family DNA-binding transcriptional regulator [Phenylobacterium sp.]|jgi:DNA-binding LacI/PurR family transcriptional regulator|uniref:LacI family DNA-binding transcriptional regulator n=1 Tax=Phenylobacterium sp. TaxID=1871053 RepID=UPI002F40195F